MSKGNGHTGEVQRFEHPGRGRDRARSVPKGRQVDFRAKEEIEALLGDRSRQRDLLIEHLHLIQDTYGQISAQHLAALADEMRDQIRAKWGERGLIELAFVIATARFYPALKRGMGYAHTCERVIVEDRVTNTPKAA